LQDQVNTGSKTVLYISTPKSRIGDLFAQFFQITYSAPILPWP